MKVRIQVLKKKVQSRDVRISTCDRLPVQSEIWSDVISFVEKTTRFYTPLWIPHLRKSAYWWEASLPSKFDVGHQILTHCKSCFSWSNIKHWTSNIDGFSRIFDAKRQFFDGGGQILTLGFFQFLIISENFHCSRQKAHKWSEGSGFRPIFWRKSEVIFMDNPWLYTYRWGKIHPSKVMMVKKEGIFVIVIAKA